MPAKPMEGYNPNTKQYNTFAMQFGWGMTSVRIIDKYIYPEKKKYKYVDKRTKKYGNPRKHNGKMGAYKERK
tara:strand:- start:658 stop:873 length:216 start_codon:yes stop_codon:yes gene_type:complete